MAYLDVSFVEVERVVAIRDNLLVLRRTKLHVTYNTPPGQGQAFRAQREDTHAALLLKYTASGLMAMLIAFE